MSTPLPDRLADLLPPSRRKTGPLHVSLLEARPWLAAIVAVDVLLILVTVVSELYPETLVVRRFNLSVEHTMGVWWSSMTLALAAVLAAGGRFEQRSARLGGYVAAVLLLGLSLDELGSLHERAPDEGRLLTLFPFAIIGAAMLLYTLAKWYPRPSTRPSAVLLALGFVCFGSVVLQEILEHAVTWPTWAIGLRTGVEEGIELLGIYLCLLAGLRLQGKNASDASVQTLPATSLLPLERIPHPLAVATLGLLAHAAAAALAPRLGGYPSLGNPAMWFPTIGFGLAAAALLARQLERGRPELVPMLLLLAFAALSAVHAVFIFPESSLDKLVWRNAGGAVIGVAALLVAGGVARRVLPLYVVPAAALAAHAALDTPETAFLAAGAVAWASLLASLRLLSDTSSTGRR